jgi:threonine dehydrogenase-like Zn-dependent dehydrogenase
LRVPYADFNCLTLPPGTEHEADFALLADIFPTGWHGVSLSGFKPGETIAVFGGGPVGLMAAYSAVLRGASRVYLVDQVKERLDQAKSIGSVGQCYHLSVYVTLTIVRFVAAAFLSTSETAIQLSKLLKIMMAWLIAR